MLFPSNAQFVPLNVGGTPVIDRVNDESPTSVDIVGSSQFPAAYYGYDGTNVFFRIRLNNDPRFKQMTFDNFAWGVLISTDSDPSTYEWVLAVDGQGNQLVLTANTIKQPGSFNDQAEGTDGKGRPNYSQPIINFDIARAALTGDGSNFDGHPNYFLDFFIPASVLFPLLGISPASPLQFLVFTATNNNNYNKDSLLNSESVTFASALSNPVTLEQGDVRARLSVSKSLISGPASLFTGQTATWQERITVTNTGRSSATRVFLTDVSGLDMIVSLAVNSVGIGVAVYNPQDRTLSWNIGILPAGVQLQLVYTVTGQFTSVGSGTRSLDTSVVTGVDLFTGQTLAPAQSTLTLGVSDVGSSSGLILDASTGLPLVGASVSLQNAGGQTVAGTVTNIGGAYGFPDLIPGSYTLTVSAADFITASQGIVITGGMVTTQNVLLQPQPAQITGTVTSSAGSPLAGASISLLDAFDAIVSTTTANGAGQYVFTGITPGNYSVTVSASGFKSAVKAVNLVRGETEVLNFALQPGPSIVNGRVVTADGVGISGALAEILDTNGNIVGSAQADPGGYYTISSLPPGSYRLRVGAPLFQLSTTGLQLSAAETRSIVTVLVPLPATLIGTISDEENGSPLAGASIRVVSALGITVASTQTDASGAYNVQSLPPGSYTVTFARDGYASETAGLILSAGETGQLNAALAKLAGTLSGLITSTAGTPLGLASIRVYLNNLIVASAQTDASGTYSISGLAPDAYSVLAEAAGFSTQTQGAFINAFHVTRADFRLAPSPGRLTGTIASAEGMPLAGAVVTIRQDSAAGPIVLRTITDSSGRYNAETLAPGNYVVTASAEDFQTGVSGAFVSSNAETVLDFALAPEPSSLLGIITDATSGAPLPNAQIEVRFLKANGVIVATAFTDAAGQYSLTGLIPGSYTIVAAADRFQTSSASVFLEPGESETADLKLEPLPGRVEGRILGAPGSQPLQGATVRISDLNGFLYELVLTDTQGLYAVDGLAPGDYVVNVFSEGYQGGMVGAIVSSGTTTPVSLTLQPTPGRIEGVVLPAMAGSTVQLLDSGGLFLFTVVTDPSGSFRFENLSPGTYLVRASAANYTTEAVGALVRPAQTAGAVITLQPNPAVISGIVTDAETGVPLFQATVKVTDTLGTLLGLGLADAQGAYSIGNLPPGNATLTVSASGYGTITGGTRLSLGEEQTQVNFTLTADRGAVSGLITSAASGLPIAGASITVSALNAQGSVIAAAASSPFGSYLIDNLAPGSYTIVVTADGYATGYAGAIVSSNETTGANTALSPLLSQISGQVLTPSGAPVTGNNIQIRLYDEQGILLQSLLAASDGTFTILQVPPGVTQLLVGAEGFVSAQGLANEALTVQTNPGQTTAVSVTLSPAPAGITGVVVNSLSGAGIEGSLVTVREQTTGRVLGSGITGADGVFVLNRLPAGTVKVIAAASTYGSSSVTLQLTPGGVQSARIPLAPNPGTLTGFVSDLVNALALSGAVLTVQDETGAIITVVSADNRGEYRTEGLAPGSYTVTARADQFIQEMLSFTITPEQTVRVSFALSPNPAALQGTVTDTFTGAPVANAVIEVRSFNSFGLSMLAVTTDALGRYSLPGLVPGNYTVIASGEGLSALTTAIVLAPGELLTLDLTLTPNPAGIRGQISDLQSGRALGGALVQVIDDTDTLVAETTADPSGQYQIDGLPPGEYTVVVSSPGSRTETRFLTLTSGAMVVLSVELQAASVSVAGQIINSIQDISKGVTVTALDENNIPVAQAVTDVEGRFTFPGLPEDPLVITSSSPNFGSQAVNVPPAGGAPVRDVVVRVPDERGDLRGTVRDVRRRPLSRALVRIYDARGRLVRSVITGFGGRYYVANLSPGRFEAQFSFPGKNTRVFTIEIADRRVTLLDVTLLDDEDE